MTMRRILALLCALFLFTATPRTAHAQSLGEAVGFAFLVIVDVAVSIGGSVTGIGSTVQLARDRPALGWSIASIVLGSLCGIFGGITLAFLIGSSDFDEPGWWVVAGVPLALSAANLTIGVVNVVRWGNAKPLPREEEEYEEVEEEEWSRAPGIGLTVSF